LVGKGLEMDVGVKARELYTNDEIMGLDSDILSIV
jgi:hypothetical protein